MSTKTVYLHSNGNLVIWGRSEYFEPSHLVEEQFRIEESVADSDDFRAIVSLYNKLVNEKELILKNRKEIEKDRKNIINLCVNRSHKLERIKNLSFWKRLFKKNILNIIKNEITLDQEKRNKK